MAKAMKCDRCGSFYDTYQGCKYRENGDYYNKLYLCRYSHANTSDLEFDMCPDCMMALISFMKGGKKNGS